MEHIYSKMVGADTRVYYLDIKKDNKGVPYLIFTEIPTKREKNGKKKRSRIFIHPNSIERLEPAIAEAIRHLKEVNKS